MAGRQKGKKRKLMVFDDHIEVISARTNSTVLKFSPREVTRAHTHGVGVSSRDIGEDNAGSGVGIDGFLTQDDDGASQRLR